MRKDSILSYCIKCNKAWLLEPKPSNPNEAFINAFFQVNHRHPNHCYCCNYLYKGDAQ